MFTNRLFQGTGQQMDIWCLNTTTGPVLY